MCDGTSNSEFLIALAHDWTHRFLAEKSSLEEWAHRAEHEDRPEFAGAFHQAAAALQTAIDALQVGLDTDAPSLHPSPITHHSHVTVTRL